MSIVGNRYFNDPNIGRAFSSLAAAFAPPSGGDAAGWAAARAKSEQASRLAELYRMATDPNTSQDMIDRYAIGAGSYTPTQSYYSVNEANQTARRGQDVSAATTQRGQDVAAATSQANNAADNRRAAGTALYQPLNPGQLRPEVPDAIAAAAFGLPAVPSVAGAPKPLTKAEVEGAERQELHEKGLLPDSLLIDTIIGEKTPVRAVGPDGKTPVFMSPGAAVRTGAQPAPSGPNTVINTGPNGEPLGSPEKGLVWARNPDGSVRFDERGAPVAISYRGGSVYQAQEAAKRAAEGKDQSAGTKNNIVLDDIDRAMGAITANPALAAGLIGQLTSGVGGTPAGNAAALLDSIRANVGFEQLQAMREASPTGGALGQVSERENTLLQSVLGSLAQSQSPEQLTYNLKRLKNVYLDIVHGVGNGPPREKLDDGSGRGAAAAVSTPQTEADFNALPSGARYRDPDDGQIYRKP